MLKKNKSISNKLSRFKTRLANFFEVFNYVIHWSLKSSKLKHTQTVFLLSTGGALHIFAILQITLLLGSSDNAARFTSYLPGSLGLDNLSISFTSGAILIFSTFLIGAIFTYIGESRVYRLATNLEEKLTINLFDLLGTQADISSTLSNEETQTNLYKSLLSSTRLAGRFLRLQLALIQPLLKSSILLAVLIFMDWKITIFILFSTIVLSTVQYLISIRAVRFSRQFDESNFKSKKFLKSKIIEIVNGNNAKSISENVSKNKFFQQSKNDYRMRLQVKQESMLASSITKACIILVLLLTITNWGSDLSIPTIKALFGYALVLVFFLISIQAALAQITAMNRFYSQVNEYIKLESKIKKFVNYNDDV